MSRLSASVLDQERHIKADYVLLIDKFYFRFMRAKDQLMVPLVKTLDGYIVAVSYRSLLFPSLT